MDKGIGSEDTCTHVHKYCSLTITPCFPFPHNYYTASKLLISLCSGGARILNGEGGGGTSILDGKC